jgi:hypothetical protein
MGLTGLYAVKIFEFLLTIGSELLRLLATVQKGSARDA